MILRDNDAALKLGPRIVMTDRVRASMIARDNEDATSSKRKFYYSYQHARIGLGCGDMS